MITLVYTHIHMLKYTHTYIHTLSCSITYIHSLCPELPIDIVYTWVNGSDPVLLAELRELRKQLPKLVLQPQLKKKKNISYMYMYNDITRKWNIYVKNVLFSCNTGSGLGVGTRIELTFDVLPFCRKNATSTAVSGSQVNSSNATTSLSNSTTNSSSPLQEEMGLKCPFKNCVPWRSLILDSRNFTSSLDLDTLRTTFPLLVGGHLSDFKLVTPQGDHVTPVYAVRMPKEHDGKC